MKKIILKLVKGALYLALVGIMMLGCKKDDEAPIYKVTFNVSPTDASVTLDGDTITATNGVVTFEKPNGSYAYSVSKEDYVEQTDEITVSSSDVLKEITLELAYEITFNVSPTDATVILGNDTITATNGVVTFEKPNGSYAYSVSKEDYVEQTDEITVSSSDVLKEITLESITYELTFNISPTDAIIILDGETKTATDGAVPFEKPKGTYKYSVSKEGYFEQSDSIIVSSSDVLKEIILELAYEITFNVSPADATVILGNDTITATEGVVKFERSNGDYPYSVSKEGYFEQTDSVTVNDDDVTVENITLELAYQVTFNVFPADATVILGNDTITATNGVVTFEKPNGSYAYSVSKEDYVEQTDEITVSSSDVLKEITLESITYELTFNISPTDAIIILDGETKTATDGAVPFEKPKGTYKYSVSKEGYFEQSDSIIVSSSDVLKEIILELAYEITFNVSPADATVILGNDTITATNGKVIFEIRYGTYTYSVSKEGYFEHIDSIIVSGGPSDNIVTVEKITLELAYTVTFNVFPADAQVTLDGETKTATDGVVTFKKPNGEYAYSVSKEGYFEYIDSIITSGALMIISLRRKALH